MAVTVASASAPWNGDHIQWVPWEQAVATAKREEKPIFMLIHKTWCSACKALEKDFSASAEIEALSEHFVMANVEDDDEPSDKQYNAQGSYSPRILFLYPDGAVADVINDSGDPGHLHFYGDAPSIVRSMLKALGAITGTHDSAEL